VPAVKALGTSDCDGCDDADDDGDAEGEKVADCVAVGLLGAARPQAGDRGTDATPRKAVVGLAPR